MPSKSPNEPNEFGGQWSIEKLNCVEEYLQAFLDVMKKQAWADLWYIDAFSGDGLQRLKGKEQERQGLFSDEEEQVQKLTTGSAMRALQVAQQSESRGAKTFEHFVFLELSQTKLESLEERIAVQFPDQLNKCQFEKGDVNKTLPSLLAKMDWSKDRGVVFIDPYATQLRWQATEAFRGSCLDVWLLFPVAGVLRMVPKDKEPDASLARTLDDIFGDAGWRSIYQQSSNVQLNMFGEESSGIHREAGEAGLLQYVSDRYAQIFSQVSQPGILRTRRNSPLFALYAMTANDSEQACAISARIAKDLLDKIGY